MKKNKYLGLLIIILVAAIVISGIFALKHNNKYSYNIRKMFSSKEVAATYGLNDASNIRLIPMSTDIDNCFFFLSVNSEDSSNIILRYTDNHFEQLVLADDIDISGTIVSRAYVRNNNLFVLLVNYDDTNDTVEESFIVIDILSKTIKKEKTVVSNSDNYENDDNIMWPINKIMCDDNYIYISYYKDKYVVDIFDYELRKVSELSSDTGLDIYPYCDTCMLYKDREYLYLYEEDSFKKIDIDNCFPKSLDIPLDYYTFFHGNEQYDFLYLISSNSDGIIDEKYEKFLYGVIDNKAVKLFSFEDLGLDADRIVDIIPDGDNFIVDETDALDGCDVYYYLEKSDISNKSMSKEVMKIGGIVISPELKTAISVFNSSNEDFYIEYVDYNFEEDYYSNLSRLNVDIVAGKIDGVILDGLDKEELINKGTLENIRTYVDTDDDIGSEVLVDYVYNSLLYEDGCIYSIYPEMTFAGFFSENPISLEAIIRQESKTHVPLVNSISLNPLTQFMVCISYSGDRFVDDQKKKLYIDDDFVELLKLFKSENEVINEMSYESASSMLKDDVATAVFRTIDFPYSYYYTKRILGDNLYCTNFTTNSPIIVPMSEIALLSSSNKDYIMESFLRFLFDESNYHTFFGNKYYPVTKIAWQDWEIRLKATNDYEDRYGEIIKAEDFYYSEDGVQEYLSTCSEQDIYKMNEMLCNSVYIPRMKDRYLEIIEEEASYYYNDIVTAEKACENMIQRLNIALNE